MRSQAILKIIGLKTVNKFVKVKLLKESYVTDRSFQNKEHVTLRIRKNKMNFDLM